MTGPELRALRQRLGYTQVELAQALGVVQGAIGDLERGRRRILPEVEARARALVYVPELCGSCLCYVAGGLPCGCREQRAA